LGFQFSNVKYDSLSEFIDRQTASGLISADGTPSYAHPVDRWILTALNSTPIKKVLDQAVHGMVDLQFGAILASSIAITDESFRDIHMIVAECSRTLGIGMPYAVARSEDHLFNAYTAGTENGAFLVISTGMLRFFDPGEVRFVIGHECGHIAAEHMTYKLAVDLLGKGVLPSMGPLGLVLQRTAGLPLMAWSRRAEITADRAGLLCARNPVAAERALVRLVGGFANQAEVKVDDFLRQSREIQSRSSTTFFQNLLASHPMIPQRIEALRLFARSDMYFRLTRQTPPPGCRPLSDRELAKRTAAMVKP
jgi:Zn-dependent protease with chaperone function